MYGGIGVSAPSLHRESTDSLIVKLIQRYRRENRETSFPLGVVDQSLAIVHWIISLYIGLSSTRFISTSSDPCN